MFHVADEKQMGQVQNVEIKFTGKAFKLRMNYPIKGLVK